MPLPIVDTRPYFSPLSREIAALLRAARDEAWARPTLAGSWTVRDVVAHLIDTALRRVSLHRDAYRGAPGPRPDQDLVSFVNDLNASWVRAARPLSPRVLRDLYARAGMELAEFMETLDLDATAFWPVSWAGEHQSRQWLDVGREFTEVWHHGSQIRDALGAGAFSHPQWLLAVLQIAIHALPHAYRSVPGSRGAALLVRVTGAASGSWNLRRHEDGWVADEGDIRDPSAIVTMSDEAAWRLFFNALSPSDADALVGVEGDIALARPLLRARSVIV